MSQMRRKFRAFGAAYAVDAVSKRRTFFQRLFKVKTSDSVRYDAVNFERRVDNATRGEKQQVSACSSLKPRIMSQMRRKILTLCRQ